MVRRTGSFAAAGEDGITYTIHVFTGFVLACPVAGPPELLKEEPEYRTSNGLELEKLGPGEFQVVSTGMMLFSADPAAR
jgi:hypothetical protein